MNFEFGDPISGDGSASDIYAGLIALDGNYGDLIDDTILLIQNLQTAYEDAVASGDTNAAQIQSELDAANAQLNSILGTDGLIQAISNAVSQAEAGNYNYDAENPSPLLAFEILDAPNGQSSSSYISSIDSALQTISNYANATSDYDEISQDLYNAETNLAGLNATLEVLSANQEDGITQADVDEVQAELDFIIQSISDILTGVNTDTTGGVSPFFNVNENEDGTITIDGGATNVNNLVMAYNNLVTAYNTLDEATSGLVASTDVMLDQDTYDAQIEAATAAGTDAAYQALTEAGIPTDETALSNYVLEQINGAIDSGALFDAQGVTDAIAQYVNNYIAGITYASDAIATQALQTYLAGEINIATTNAVDDALEGMVAEGTIPEGYVLDDGIGQAEVDAAVDAAVAQVLTDIQTAGLVTDGTSVEELQDALVAYVDNYIAENNLVASTDNMLTNEQLASEIANAIRAYVNNFIAGTTDPVDATATEQLQNYITNEIAAAVAEITPEDGITQQDVNAVQSLLDAALNEISNLESLLEVATTGGSAQLNAAYDLIEALEEEASAQFQAYQDDIDAYETFLSNLSSSMSRLEAFLSENYGYDAYDTTTIPNSENIPSGLAANQDFMTNPYVSVEPQFSGGKMPLPDIYLNFAGSVSRTTRGFRDTKNLPMLNAKGSADTEAEVELNPKAKSVVGVLGITLAAFGIYTLLKKK